MLTYFIKIIELQSGLRKKKEKEEKEKESSADFALGIILFYGWLPSHTILERLLFRWGSLTSAIHC